MKSKTLLPGEWALMMLLVDITEDKTAPAQATFQLLPKEEELMLQPRDVLLLATPATGERAEGTLLCSIPSLLQTLSVSYLSPLLPPETTPGCLSAAFSILMAERLHCTSLPNSGAHTRGFLHGVTSRNLWHLLSIPGSHPCLQCPQQTWTMSAHSKLLLPSVPLCCRTPQRLFHLLHLNFSSNWVLEACNP